MSVYRSASFVKFALSGLLALTSQPAGALIIDPTWSSGVTPAEQAGFTYAAQQIETLFTNDITVNITVQPDTTLALAGSQSYIGYVSNTPTDPNYSYATISSAINANGGPVLLPAIDPAPSGSVIAVTTAEAKAIGLYPANDPGTDGIFGFNPNQAYTFDPNNQSVSGQYSFIGLAEHEISEILGRITVLGQSFGNGQTFITPMDLYRYTAVGVHSFSATDTGVYFSLDGGKTVLQNFNSNSGADLQDWALGGNAHDAFNAYDYVGVALGITPVDISAMQVLGYQLSAVPLPAGVWLFASGLLGWGLVGKRRR